MALLAALIAVQALTSGQSLQADPATAGRDGRRGGRTAGPAPFLVVIVAAAGTAALIRLC